MISFGWQGRGSRLGLPNLITTAFIEPPQLSISSTIDPCNGTAALSGNSSFVDNSMIFEWVYNNQVIAGQNGQQLQANAAGDYTFRVYVQVPCQAQPISYETTTNIQFPPVLSILSTRP